ncbi:MAG: GNAT family N-acetyltransferase [Caryophanon sp.]|nr:GNAT family N-acetyltransferase [Caryophanon sp.]
MASVIGEHVILRTFTMQDAQQVTELVVRNKHYWATFEPLHHDHFYTYDTQYRKIVESLNLMRSNREFSFGIFDKETEQLIGQISLFSLKRLPYSSGLVGYSIDERCIGQGVASEALALAVQFAFQTAKLHRIEAYVSPNNVGSIRVLEKNGFVREGLMRKLLYINGKWEDHYLYAQLIEEYEGK